MLQLPVWSGQAKVYVQAPVLAGGGVAPHDPLYGTPGPGQLTLFPSLILHCTWSGVAVAVAEIPPMLAVAVTGCQAAAFTVRYTGRLMTAGTGDAGDVLIWGSGSCSSEDAC